jgi:hypothetical protein
MILLILFLIILIPILMFVKRWLRMRRLRSGILFADSKLPFAEKAPEEFHKARKPVTLGNFMGAPVISGLNLDDFRFVLLLE